MLRALFFSASALAAGLLLNVNCSAEPDRPQANPAADRQYPANAPSVSRARAGRSNVSDDIAVQALHNFGACVVANTPQGARETLAMDYRTAEYQRKIRALAKGHADGRCMLSYSRLAASQTLIAGAMAEALIKSDFRPSDLSRELSYDPGRALIEARSPLERMALCSVMKAPDAILKLFSTEPATSDEQAAMKPVTDVLADCLTKDVRLDINIPAARALLALAAWRIAKTPMVSKP